MFLKGWIIMQNFRVIELKKNVYAKNDEVAVEVRQQNKLDNLFLLNLMSSPGSGKTTTLVQVINKMKEDFKMGIIEADIDSDVDAATISKTGAEVIQLHTGGMCHLDASMTLEGLELFNTKDLDLVVLENVGNLVCPASFDTGATMNAMILSVPEGDDKPLKYPKMFSIVDLLIVNKMDAVDYFDFDLDAVKERVKALNPNIQVFPISARTGQGVDALCDWLTNKIKTWRTQNG
jgi:hydrogenase nickel incorporation protein HypB